LREWRLGYHECRSLGPSSALKGIADGNSRKSRVPAVAEVRRKFGNRVARIDNTFCLLVLAPLQVGIGKKVERMIARGVLGSIGGGLRIDARCVSHR
jgi:hypothetical protein